MLPLHDQTRRSICILAFLALGVLPTAVAAGWCFWLRLPGRTRAEAESLSRQLGLTVVLEGVQYPKPGVVRYRGVRIHEPETGRLILRCDALEVGRMVPADAAEGRLAPALPLSVSGGETDLGALDELGSLIQRVMEGRAGAREPQVRVWAGDVKLHSAEGIPLLKEVQVEVVTRPGEIVTAIGFRVPALNMPRLATIKVRRNRQTTPPSTTFVLDTGDAPLPCWLLAKGLPLLRRFGPRSSFQGAIGVEESAGALRGDLWGIFADFDLGRLVADFPAYQLTGTGRLMLQRAQFRDGCLETADGEFWAGSGSISRSLWESASERLSLVRGIEAIPGNDPLPFEQMGFWFSLDAKGLRLVGRCASSGAPGAILIDRYGRLLGDPTVERIPATALVQLLLPSSDAQVPAHRQSEQMLRWLPIPDAVWSGGPAGGISRVPATSGGAVPEKR